MELAEQKNIKERGLNIIKDKELLKLIEKVKRLDKKRTIISEFISQQPHLFFQWFYLYFF